MMVDECSCAVSLFGHAPGCRFYPKPAPATLSLLSDSDIERIARRVAELLNVARQSVAPQCECNVDGHAAFCPAKVPR